MKNSTCRTTVLLMCALGGACFDDSVPPAYDYGQNDASSTGRADAGGSVDTRDAALPRSDGGEPVERDANVAPSSDAAVIGMPSGPCDLTGRWLVTTHKVVSAFGAVETIHNYLYYEISKQGDAYVISKGYYCGDDVTGPALSLFNDTSGYWATARAKVDVASRTVTSAPGASGCDVSFGRIYTVTGASVDYVKDTTLPMPTVDQPAKDGTPGWEDWEPDGEPGITANVTSSVARGRLFTCLRDWTEYSGSVPDVSSKIRLTLAWNQEQSTLGADNAFLTFNPAISGDPTAHFVELTRLSSDQAVGDDAAICAAVVQLAPQLTPDAAGSAR